MVGSGTKGDQRCARGFAVLQYTRKHGLVRERRVCVTSGPVLARGATYSSRDVVNVYGSARSRGVVAIEEETMLAALSRPP